MITAKVISKPYPAVVFSNGKEISYNCQNDKKLNPDKITDEVQFEHNLKNAMASAKLFNGLDKSGKKKALEAMFGE